VNRLSTVTFENFLMW